MWGNAMVQDGCRGTQGQIQYLLRVLVLGMYNGNWVPMWGNAMVVEGKAKFITSIVEAPWNVQRGNAMFQLLVHGVLAWGSAMFVGVRRAKSSTFTVHSSLVVHWEWGVPIWGNATIVLVHRTKYTGRNSATQSCTGRNENPYCRPHRYRCATPTAALPRKEGPKGA